MSKATIKQRPRTAERRRGREVSAGQTGEATGEASGVASGPIRGSRLHAALVAAIVLVCTLGVFQAVRQFDFVLLDDNIHVYQNPHLNPPSSGNIAYFWHQAYQNLYIPMTYTVWMLLAQVASHAGPHAIFGGDTVALDPTVFHTANLSVHLGTTLLVFLLLRRLVRNNWAAGAGALLFAIHPVQAESVAWISEMKGLLCGFLSVLALWLYVAAAQSRASGRGWLIYGLATVACLLALLAKPSAVALPLLAAVIDFCVLRRPARQAAATLAPWLTLAACFAVIAHGAQPVSNALISAPLWARPLVAADAITFYLGKVLVPIPLGSDYGRTPQYVMAHAACWLALPFVIALAWAAWRFRARCPWLSTAFGLFAAAIAPVLGLVPFLYQQFSTVADRYLYLAMLGPAFALATVLSTAKLKTAGYAAVAVAAVWLVALGGLTVAQAGTWRNNLTFFEHAQAINPNSWLVHVNLASAYGKLGRRSDAIRTAQLAFQEMRNERTYTQLGIQLSLDQQYSEAIPLLQRAMALDPSSTGDARRNLVKAENDIAFTLARAGHIPEAIGHWTTAIGLKTDYVEAHYNLGLAYSATGQRDQALSELKTALQYAPTYAPAQSALAKVEAQAGGGGR